MAALLTDKENALADLKKAIVAAGENDNETVRNAVKTAFGELKTAVGAMDAGAQKTAAQTAMTALKEALGDDGGADIYNDMEKVVKVVGVADSAVKPSDNGLIGAVAIGAGSDDDASWTNCDATVKEKASALISAIISNTGVIDKDAVDNTNYLIKAYDLYVAYADLLEKADADANVKGKSQVSAVTAAYTALGSADDYVEKVLNTTDSDKVKALKDKLAELKAVPSASTDVTGAVDTMVTKLGLVVDSNYVTNLYDYAAAKKAVDELTGTSTEDAIDTAVGNFTTLANKAYNAGDVKTKATAVKDAAEAYAKALVATTTLNTLTGNEGYSGSFRKEVMVCAAASQPVKFVMDSKATLNPTDTGLSKMFSDDKDNRTNQILINLYDQYGTNLGLDDVVYTISLTKENKGEFAHKDGGIEIKNNGTHEPEIVGAEIGDTFTVEAKVKGKDITAKCNLTIGADKSAYIADKGANTKSDETFRQTYLGYIK